MGSFGVLWSCSSAMVAVSDNGLVDSLDDGESNDDESEKWVSSSRMDATVVSCNSFLLLSALFLLRHLASIVL